MEVSKCWVKGDVLDSFPCLRRLCVRSVDVITSIIMSTSIVPSSMVVSNGLVEYCLLNALHRDCASYDRPGINYSIHALGTSFLDVVRINTMNFNRDIEIQRPLFFCAFSILLYI